MKTTVSCENTKCVYCDQEKWTCTREIIRVGENYPDGCMDYLPYTVTADYMNPFYICVETEDGTLAKAEKRGMKIDYVCGMCFYTHERLTPDLRCSLTEERTGYRCGTLHALVNDPDIIKQIMERAKELPDVNTLPLAQWEKTDEISGHYVLVETPEKAEGAEETEEPEE